MFFSVQAVKEITENFFQISLTPWKKTIIEPFNFQLSEIVIDHFIHLIERSLEFFFESFYFDNPFDSMNAKFFFEKQNFVISSLLI